MFAGFNYKRTGGNLSARAKAAPDRVLKRKDAHEDASCGRLKPGDNQIYNYMYKHCIVFNNKFGYEYNLHFFITEQIP